MVPLAIAYGIAVTAVNILLLLAPGRFTGLGGNLSHAVGDVSPRSLRRLVRANARNLGRSWVDVLRMSRPSACARRLDVVGQAHLTAALERGRGVVMVASHLGPWDAGLVAFNRDSRRVAVLREVVSPARLFEHLRRGRDKLGVTIIPIDVAAMRQAAPDVARSLGASALRRVFTELRRNGTVVIAIDRDLTGTGTPMPFFGEATPIPLGVVDIAMRCNAALLPVWSVRERGRLCLHAVPEVAYDLDADRHAEVLRVAAEVIARFEPVITEHADQWHVLDPIWPIPPVRRTRRGFFQLAGAVVTLLGVALVAAGLSGWGLGLTSATSAPDWWQRPALGSAISAVALFTLPTAVLSARAHGARFLANVGRAAMYLTVAALVTGISGVMVGALRA